MCNLWLKHGQLLLRSPFTLPQALLEVGLTVDRGDEVSQALVDMFLFKCSMSEYLRVLFEREIAVFTETNKAVLFRTDSLATMVMSKYLNRVGYEYLDMIVSPVLLALKNHPEGLEIDPSVDSVKAGEDTASLLLIAEKLLERIVQSASECPRYVHPLSLSFRVILLKS
jgi:hypothetical protein